MDNDTLDHAAEALHQRRQITHHPKHDPWSSLTQKEEVLDALGDALQALRTALTKQPQLADTYYRARKVYNEHRSHKH